MKESKKMQGKLGNLELSDLVEMAKTQPDTALQFAYGEGLLEGIKRGKVMGTEKEEFETIAQYDASVLSNQ